MRTMQNFLFLAPSSHALILHPTTFFLCLLLPFLPGFSYFCSSITLLTLIKGVTAGCMNEFGWTPSSARKNSKNARNGQVSDKKEIPFSKLDRKPRNNRNSDNRCGEIKGVMTKNEMGGDGTGCLNRHRSRFDTTIMTQ